MAHTPGPWSTGHIRKQSSLQSWNEHFVHVGAPGVNGGQGNVIAVVHMGGAGAISNTPDDLEANAKLIAAAPQLLAACEAALSSNPLMTGKAQITIDEEAWDLIRAAVTMAKAEK